MNTHVIERAPKDPTARADWARRHTLTRYVPHKVIREDRADGTILLRKPAPWDVREISRSIDKLPLRKQEVRDRHSAVRPPMDAPAE